MKSVITEEDKIGKDALQIFHSSLSGKIKELKAEDITVVKTKRPKNFLNY